MNTETVLPPQCSIRQLAHASERDQKARRGELNSFQRSMLQWNELHPYNAVHVVRISDALDLGRLRTAISGTLEAYGLTNLSLDQHQGTFRYQGGPVRCEIRVLPGEDASCRSLAAEIERQLNAGFTEAECSNPFRFFVEAHEDSFLLGLVYFHPIADAEAVARLLMQIVHAYEGKADPEPSDRMDLYPPRHDSLFRQRPALLARKLAALPAAFQVMRRSLRPPCTDTQDLHTGFTLFSLAPESFHLLVDTARKLGVTLHDLFLALLMKALSPLAAARQRSGRRRNISIGTIVNLRGDLGPVNSRSFGLCLGSFMVTHPVPKDVTVMGLARDIRGQTFKIKRHRLYLGVPLELVFGGWMLRLFSTARKKKFFQKHYPLWGGITNMNLNPICKEAGGAGPADYFRAVSTGPVTPLVLSITTIRDAVNIGLTYRTTVYPSAEIQRVQQRLLEAIRELEVRP